jgi:hypothetical protein
VEEVARLYDAWSEGVPVHRIHGDCHVGNLLRGDAGWFFLDFDDFVVGPAVQDVWMLLPGRDHEGARQRALLVEAYRQFRDFDPRWLRLVEPLRGFRFVFYADWIARRWEDPAFPDAFPHFGSPRYWEDETRDLEEQVERLLRTGEATLQRPEGEVSEEAEPTTWSARSSISRRSATRSSWPTTTRRTRSRISPTSSVTPWPSPRPRSGRTAT